MTETSHLRALRPVAVATLTIAALLVSACAQDDTTTADDNAAVVSRFIEEFKNQANHDIVLELFADDFVHHLPDPRLPAGREGMIALGQGVVSGFPDVQVTVEDLIATDDTVVERTTARGTHDGEFLGVPATGSQVVWSEIHIYRLADGKVVEYWPQVDILSIMQQIGAIPAPGE